MGLGLGFWVFCVAFFFPITDISKIYVHTQFCLGALEIFFFLSFLFPGSITDDASWLLSDRDSAKHLSFLPGNSQSYSLCLNTVVSLCHVQGEISRALLRSSTSLP